jgi:hypothetical protein
MSATPTGDPKLVERAKARAHQWLAAVDPSIQGFTFSVSHHLTYSEAPNLKLIEEAFRNHFKLILDSSKATTDYPNATVFDPKTDTQFLPVIKGNFAKLKKTLADTSKFTFVTAAFALDEAKGLFAAYVMGAGLGNPIRFTPDFNTCGPNCQAAIVLHESVHVFDSRSNDGPVHISEFDATYNSQTTDNAIHNPSAYSAFAQQVSLHRDTRFGQGPGKRGI